jgi:hypothetical protein
MSSSWCMCCMSHPQDWKVHPLPECDNWMIQKIKDCKLQIDAGVLKGPSEIRGIVNNPIWDFIEPTHMVFLELHMEIGLVNNVLDSFYLFVDDQVEAPTAEEKCCRNSYIVADVALTKATERLADWKETDKLHYKVISMRQHRFVNC